MTASIATKTRRGWRAPKFALAIPSIVWYALFFVVPILYVVYYSFGTKDTSLVIPVDLTNLTTSNYSEVFDETFFTVFRATIRIAVVATGLCVLIGLPVAYFAAFKVSERWRAIILALVVVPSFTSFLIRTVAWRIPLAPNGTLSRFLMDIGWVGPNGIQVLETSVAVQLAIVYNYLGFMILPLFVALDRIDVRMREASKDLGAGRVATFFGVTLPLAGPGVVAGVLLTFIPMCGDYVTATVLGGAKGNMIGAMIASQFSGAQNWPLGAAMAVLMIAAVLVALGAGTVVVWVVPRVVGLFSPVLQRVRRIAYGRTREKAVSGRLRRVRSIEPLKIGLGAWVVIVLLFLFVPIFLVFLHSFNRSTSFTIWSGHTSVKWWGELFDSSTAWRVVLIIAATSVVAVAAKNILGRTIGMSRRVSNLLVPTAFSVAVIYSALTTDTFRDVFDFAGIGDAIRNSFIAALGATIIAVVLGGLAGVALARRPGRWATAFMVVLFLILVTPEIMDAVALATWFPRLVDVPVIGYPFRNGWGPFNGGINKLWVGQSLYASAVVTLIVRARLQGLDESLEEAAADLGAPPGRAFRQITLPLISSALVAGGLLSFTLCLDNAVISTLISEAGSTTFPVALLGATRSTIKPFWGAGAMILFMVTMAALWFVAVVLRRSGSSSSEIASTLTGS